MNFSIQPDNLREVDEARTAMLALAWDVNTPQALRCRPSSLTPQTTTEITPCINLLVSGKESSAFQAVGRQGRLSQKACTFIVRCIRRFGMACLKQGPFTLTGWGEDWESEADGEREVSVSHLINILTGHCCPDGGC